MVTWSLQSLLGDWIGVEVCFGADFSSARAGVLSLSNISSRLVHRRVCMVSSFLADVSV